ncbi:MAG: flagellar export chaperone FliS [Firmicutes bacterium]|nr:flagellar export chaperone FliS [Bacillota bacterium]
MAINNPYAKLKNDSIYLATPEELILMLYDGALKFSNQAMVAMEKKDYQKSNYLIQRVQDIIRELQTSLDFKYEISNDFYAMYDYIFRTLITANIRKDQKKLEEAMGLIRQFRDTWKEAMKIARAEKG